MLLLRLFRKFLSRAVRFATEHHVQDLHFHMVIQDTVFDSAKELLLATTHIGATFTCLVFLITSKKGGVELPHMHRASQKKVPTFEIHGTISTTQI